MVRRHACKSRALRASRVSVLTAGQGSGGTISSGLRVVAVSVDVVGHGGDGVSDLAVFGGVDEALVDEIGSVGAKAGDSETEPAGDVAGLRGGALVFCHGCVG